MKILFVNPCLRPEASLRYLPVGLGYVMTAVQDAGYSFDVLDMDISSMSNDTMEKYIATHSYDVIAAGAIVSHYKWFKWFIDTTKKHQPHCKVIIGNSVGSSVPEILFNHTKVDIVILGEADATIVDVLRAIEEDKTLGELIEPPTPVLHDNGDAPPTYKGEGIPGIVFRDHAGRIVHTGKRKAIKNADDISFPNWDLFDVEAYFKFDPNFGASHRPTRFAYEETRVIPVNTARGCVFKCTFCHHAFWEDPYRHRSPQSVIAEIKRNQEKYGANYILFWDELTFYKWKPTEKFVDALLEADLGIHWQAPVRSDLFGNPEVPYENRRRVAQKCLDAGALAFGYSLESANEQILNDMNKRIKAEYFLEQAKLLRDVGITSNTSVVVGYPRETPETIAETMSMCEEAGVYPSVGFLLPLPETGMWRYAVENNHIKDVEQFLANMTERQDIVLNMTKMSNETMQGEVTTWLNRLNKGFGGHLKSENLIRTKGYGQHQKHQDEKKAACA